jgi:4-amino-4-deoxy-L-arabinose transferase-like glycosyltransferase
LKENPVLLVPLHVGLVYRLKKSSDSLRWIALLLAVVVGVRLLTLGAYPFFATTEPRYAEIARKMLETQNWVTPWFDHGVPFWGKPPLSFWGSAATMALWGVDEFGARLAPFLAALATAALFWAWPVAAPVRRVVPAAAALVMLSSLVGFVAAGAVMTDMFMAGGTTLSMLGLWRALNDAGRTTGWRWAFFVGLALGFLAKGPVACVITAVALGVWLLPAPLVRVSAVWRALPWGRGLLLAAALTLPWYGLAEQRTPGFLQYFLVGEHLQRFLVSGWTGDLYGAGHAEPRGLIWWFAVGGFLPWTPVAGLAASLLWRPRPVASGQDLAPVPASEWQYLLGWTLAPLLFFTLARNILEAYVLPGLPAFALLTALLLVRAGCTRRWLRPAWGLALLWPLLGCGVLWAYPEWMAQRSQKALLQHWTPGTPLVYLAVRPLSANFYSKGQAVLAASPADMQRWLDNRQATLVVEQPWLDTLSPQQLVGWRVVARHAGFTMLHR